MSWLRAHFRRQAKQTSPTVAQSGGGGQGRINQSSYWSRYEEKRGYSKGNKGDVLRELVGGKGGLVTRCDSHLFCIQYSTT